MTRLELDVTPIQQHTHDPKCGRLTCYYRGATPPRKCTAELIENGLREIGYNPSPGLMAQLYDDCAKRRSSTGSE